MPLQPSTIAAINAALAQAGLAATTGNVFYLDPANGLDTNDGQTPATTPGGHGPVQTLQAGYNLLRSGYNDVLVLIGNGASTGSARLSATFTWAKNAAHLIGVCAPSAISQRARIAPTLNIAGFANFFVVSGNGCLFQNLSWFHGFNVGVAAEICLTVSGERNAFVNCDIEGMGDTSAGAGAADTGSRCILLTGGGENFFKHCNVGLDTVTRTNANFTVELKAGSPRNMFEDCTFLMPHQQRVVDEKNELDLKLGKLRIFLNGAIFPTLDEAERKRLIEQTNLMNGYSGVLGQRIAAFS